MKKELISEEMILIEDHFEFESGLAGGTPDRFGSQNHADLADAAENVPVYGQIYGYGRKIAGALGSVGDALGLNKHEDTSLTGWKNFQQLWKGLPFYPTKDEMLQAAQLGKWESVEPAAIQASYDPATGTWVRGDWHFQVIGTSPITVKDFKGANETHTFSAPVYAKGGGQQMNSPASAAVTMSNASSGVPNPSLSAAQQAILASLPAGTTPQQASQALANAGMPAAGNPFTGAANVTGFSLFGGMSTAMSVGIILAVLAVVALIIWVANK